MKKILQIFLLTFLIYPLAGSAQSGGGNDSVVFKLSLGEVIALAQKQSLEMLVSKNSYISKYWTFNAYKASLLPSMNFESRIFDFGNSLEKVFSETNNTYIQRKEQSLTTGANFNINQVLPLTGGSFSLSSGGIHYENLKDKSSSYYSINPLVNIGYQQNFDGFNEIRWLKRMEPLKFEIAKKAFLQRNEEIAKLAIAHYFNLLTSQINLNIAQTNYANADTLFRIGKGRFQIGTITRDELLDLELSVLNSRLELSRSKIEIEKTRSQLRNFLMLPDKTTIDCDVPNEIPTETVNFDVIYNKALTNNPDQKNFNLRKLNADRMVAKNKADNGLHANLRTTVGLQGYNKEIQPIIDNPNNYQRATVDLTVPLWDWGKRKGELLVAKANREAELASIEKEKRQFEQDLFINIAEFNLMAEQVAISAKADTIAQLGYDITKQRFLIGKIDVIKLNAARTAMERARTSFLTSLKDYWTRYYDIRAISLYDFKLNSDLSVQFDKLIEGQKFSR